MVINWNNMDVGKNETMHFNQPTKNAAVLNRVNSIDPTLIQGALNANGRVFIVNPNGVLIGNGATVNVGSLVASSLDIKDTDFMKGELKFSGNGKGSVINQGKITAADSAVLIGAGEVGNQGSIYAGKGNVALAAGENITLYFPSMGKINVRINKGSLTALVNNGGMIVTKDGSIALSAWATDMLTRSVVNNTGTLEANQMIQRADGVYLESMGNGSVDIAGKTSGTVIAASGNEVNIRDGAELKGSAGTFLISNADNGHVRLGKSSIHGDVKINADNVLSDGAGREPTFVNTNLVSVNSASKDLTVGAKAITQPSQIKPGKGVISEGVVTAVAKSKAQLSVMTMGGDINLDNATLDYGNLELTSLSGNVNINNITKGDSLNIIAGREFKQSNGADINMENNLTILAEEGISQHGNLTAGHHIGVHSYYGDVTQSTGKKSTASSVNYQGRSVNINGEVKADLLNLVANNFKQGAQSSLEARKSYLHGGDFDLASGAVNLDSIYLDANSLNLRTQSSTEIADYSHLVGDLNINSTENVNLGMLTAGGTINVTANNITAESRSIPGSTSWLYSGKDTVLNAKNDINIGSVQAGESYVSSSKANVKLTGNNISAALVDASGDIMAVASDNISLVLAAATNTALNAKNDINVGSIYARYSYGEVPDKNGVQLNGKSIAAGNIDASGDIKVVADNDVTMRDVNGQSIDIRANSDINLVSANSSSGMIKLSAGNDIASSGVMSGAGVNIDAGGSVQVQYVGSSRDLNIAAGNDVKFSDTVGADDNVYISGNNIIAENAPLYGSSIISSGLNTVLTAKDTINVGAIQAGEYWSPSKGSVYLNGKNISTGNISVIGGVKAVADNAITMQSIGAETVDLWAKNDINVGTVLSESLLKATSTMGSITFGVLYGTDNRQLNAANGVHIGTDYNAYWPYY